MDRVVVEHMFITVMEPAQAIGAAGELLLRHKFVAAGRQGFAMGTDLPETAEFVRLKKSQFMRLSNSNFLNRAQKVRLDFDRGRVTAVVGIDDASAGSVTITTRGRLFGGKRRRRLLELEQEYLIGIANALDTRLAKGASVEAAEQSILIPADEIAAIGRRQTRIGLIVVAIIVLFFASLIAIAIFASTHR